MSTGLRGRTAAIGAGGRGIGPGEMGSFIGVTTAIAQFMRELERAWEAHQEALLVRRDLAAALAPLAAEPSVVHIPAMTGALGGPPSSASTPTSSSRTCPATWY